MGPCGTKLSENVKSWLAKGFAVAYGLISFGVVFIVKYLPGVLQAALGIFGIVGGPVLGGFTLGMFFPWANGTGCFTGMISSLIFTMWFGFGQSYAVNCHTYKVVSLPTDVSGCPAEWFNFTTTTSTTTTTMAPDEDPNTCEGFTHLKIYEISYLWNAAISTMFTFVVGAAVSMFTKPQNPRTLNPDLISPALPGLFCWWPKQVREYIDSLQIGSDYVQTKRHMTLKMSQIMGTSPSQMLGLDPGMTEDMDNGYSQTNLAFRMDDSSEKIKESVLKEKTIKFSS
jgi:Na+/proline symporter